MKSPIIKHSIVIAGHKTSISLEDEFWTSLRHIARTSKTTLSNLITGVDGQRAHGNLSSAIRLFVLAHFKNQIPVPAGLPVSHREVVQRTAPEDIAIRRLRA
jgi:predicted DNA-binding ribbon-helix-helix protein